MSVTKNSKVYAAALILFLSGVAYLMFAGISENSVYFLNVSEALTIPVDQVRSARLFGTVKKEGIARMENDSGIQFQLEDKDDAGKTLHVTFSGIVPDTFKAGAEVIVEGSFADAGKIFKAEVLMTKCPSKYQKENRT
ncbi:MAG: cytochrome c maturation protein CcmE [Desulfovibrio sp.]|jgi:cytochrome c-type biogenesis protein CcmE|nr:cytochrome c maturation protein CcmE [Desulfovibrio sp.]